jgi:hypothetical protein
MASIFERLSFPRDITSNVVTFSTDVTNYMNTLPKLTPDWQYTDVRNRDISANTYFKNPVANTTNNIITLSNLLTTVCTGIIDLSAIYSASANVSECANNFYYHTDRLSGVTQPNGNTASLPHYQTAIGVGKNLTYLLYQHEGIANNSAIVGNFGSLYSNNTLTMYRNSISTYPQIIASTVYIENLVDIYGQPYQVVRSNLSPTLITSITSNLSNISSYMINRQSSDVRFYNESQNVTSELTTFKKFSNLGQTEKSLFNDLIGTDKLKARIN